MVGPEQKRSTCTAYRNTTVYPSMLSAGSIPSPTKDLSVCAASGLQVCEVDVMMERCE